jgi:hypothetical protein
MTKIFTTYNSNFFFLKKNTTLICLPKNQNLPRLEKLCAVQILELSSTNVNLELQQLLLLTLLQLTYLLHLSIISPSRNSHKALDQLHKKPSIFFLHQAQKVFRRNQAQKVFGGVGERVGTKEGKKY